MANKPTYAGKISNHGTQVVKAPIAPQGKSGTTKKQVGNDLRSK